MGEEVFLSLIFVAMYMCVFVLSLGDSLSGACGKAGAIFDV